MATTLQPVDVVTVGVGWTGAILAKELTKAGLTVVGLERGGYRDTYPDFVTPSMHDDLKYARRFELFQDLSRSTVTHRNNSSEIARPMRYHGPFPWGEGLGGAGVHWGASTWRHTPWDFKVKSMTLERYGEAAWPEDCTSQDWPMTYDELEPFYDKWEYDIGLAGKAGNLNGEIQEGGNPFEGFRSREYPNPPHPVSYPQTLFIKAAEELGYHPFPQPAATMTQAYTNPDGVTQGQCVYCGHCSSFGCEVSAKASPQTTVLPTAIASGKFELRTHAAVTRVNLDSTGKKAVSVTYLDRFGMEYEQPADLILLTAFTWSNVQLLLVSGIGTQYDPETGTGLVGKNYSWHGSSPAATLFFDEGHVFNRFMGAGGLGTRICDLQGDNFDHTGLGFIGGANIGVGVGGAGPLTAQPVPPGTPAFGAEWKQAVAHYYNRSFGVSGLYDNQSYRGHYLDLDPNYKDAYGLPLLRVTFDNMPMEKKAHEYLAGKIEEIVTAINPTRYVVSALPEHFDAGAGYGVVHQVGGAMAGESPHDSVVNKYQQSWDVPNLFVVGASAFPQIPSFNPTGHVGAMAYYTADAIVNKYVATPGPLV